MLGGSTHSREKRLQSGAEEGSQQLETDYSLRTLEDILILSDSQVAFMAIRRVGRVGRSGATYDDLFDIKCHRPAHKVWMGQVPHWSSWKRKGRRGGLAGNGTFSMEERGGIDLITGGGINQAWKETRKASGEGSPGYGMGYWSTQLQTLL